MRIFVAVIFLMFFSGFSHCQNLKVVEKNAAPTIELKSLMLWLIDPAADAIWDSVSTIIDRNGTTNIAPKNDEEWESLRQQAAVLTEAGNLLMMPNRVQPGKIWALAAKKLNTSGFLALQATLNKDPDLLFKAGEEIYKSCAGCHQAYANFEKSSSFTPAGAKVINQASNSSNIYQIANKY
ncbi:hypothetical protein [Polynucleobacter rarus]|uniref:hypothetical protein n=1 Tax=Polynucleobacter rarus TaxID=556055 RepID=UPI000D3E0FB5|nr:hypothetical protein [Polynucleobacter rarus]